MYTQKNLYYSLYHFFLMNVGALLLCKSHRNPPEPIKNLAEQTEKPIKTHYKPCKYSIWHKKRSKIKTMKEILQNWGALQVLVFSSNKMINKHITMLNWRKQIFCICPDIERRVCYIVCLVSSLGLCALHVEIKEELNQLKYYKN